MNALTRMGKFFGMAMGMVQPRYMDMTTSQRLVFFAFTAAIPISFAVLILTLLKPPQLSLIVLEIAYIWLVSSLAEKYKISIRGKSVRN